jgi:hypothetical protein
MTPVPRSAVICRLGTCSIECVYFTGVSAHLYHKGFLPGGLHGSPSDFSYAVLMLFFRFYLLPGGMVIVLRFAVYWLMATRSMESVYFTSFLHISIKYVSYLVNCLAFRLAFPMLFICLSLGFTWLRLPRLPLTAAWRSVV